ncbi:DUF7289 family protein [Natronorubrum aibiense]|uniref:Uncharacterized protein n=1 Tax=Natronorubrum aibiense TaxID=348826 RepID=A0A5P9P4A5_9EURY|nr:hypothetical protein [Natronorubrum aibiense]QFU82974.1 hypothetical protein GCU68_10735 [Natronorubrum aibiense]
MRRDTPATTDRAVSEVVAFVLVFAIILGSVGILYSTGFQAMDDYQETEQLVNAERAMDALASNFNDIIRYNGVNQRYGELSLRGGAVRSSDSGTNLDILIEKDDENRSISDRDDAEFLQYYTGETLDLGEFAYTSDGDRIAYEGGGLVRGDDSEDWSLVRKQPHITCSDDREAAVISLVTISADDRSVQSSSGLGVTMSVENRSSAVYTDDVDSVSITIDDDDTAYNDAWNSTLDTDRGWTDNDNGDDLRRTCPADRVVVTIVEVDLEY